VEYSQKIWGREGKAAVKNKPDAQFFQLFAQKKPDNLEEKSGDITRVWEIILRQFLSKFPHSSLWKTPLQNRKRIE